MKNSEAPAATSIVLVLLCSCGDQGASSTGGGASTTANASGSDDRDSQPDVATGGSETSTTADESSSSGDSSGDGGKDTPPQASDDRYHRTQDQILRVPVELGLLANDVDLDGDALIIVSGDVATEHGGGALVDEDGTLTYTPAAGFFGIDRFAYTISDGTHEVEAEVELVVFPTTTIDFVDHANEPCGDVLGEYAAGVDIDADGQGDLLLGMPMAGSSGAGSRPGWGVFGGEIPPAFAIDDVGGTIPGVRLLPEADPSGSGAFLESALATDPAPVGDFDGNGTAEFIVGAPFANRAYVMQGGVTHDVYLDTVADGVGGFVIYGEPNEIAFAGSSLDGVGDVNGDGFADVAVGDAGANRAYVVFGRAQAQAVMLSDVADGVGGFTIRCEPSDGCGNSVRAAGDVNGDGLDDVILGASAASAATGPGRAYVVFGREETDAVEVADLVTNDAGLVLHGEGEHDQAGQSVAGVGDLDGDGLDDLAVGAPGFGDGMTTDTGRVYVVHGVASADDIDLAAVASEQGGFVIDGERLGDGAGWSLARLGDVDGDGRNDFAIGGYRSDPEGVVQAGRTYVVFDADRQGSWRLSEITAGVGGFVHDGGDAHEQSGHTLRSAGDLDGNGVDDVGVGTFLCRAHVLFGVSS